MKITTEGKELVIRARIATPVLSSTGRSYILVSSDSFETGEAKFDGKPIAVLLKAIIPVKEKR